jgi:endonuclease/exonuclease/phosphatase (EEP) superfamily protein YafD
MEQWLSLVFLAFFAGLNLVCVAPYYLTPKPEISANATQLKLLHINVFGKTNQNPQAVISLIRTEKPDVLDLVEYTEQWQRRLESTGIFKAYPYRVAGRGHIALYSKRPLKNARLTYAGIQKIANQANIIAQITLDHQPVTLLVAHPASPIMPSHLQWLKESFNTWTQERKALGRNLLIVGDLNTSPWSQEFHTLTQNTGLRDSQLGYGIQPSWPMLLPFFGIRTEPNWLTQLLLIPIDHVLVSDRIQIVSRRTGPFVGSDHLPVIVEFALGKPSAQPPHAPKHTI